MSRTALFLVPFVAGCLVPAGSRTDRLVPEASFTAIEVLGGDGGDVAVFGGATGQELVRELTWAGDVPDARAWTDGGVLFLDLTCASLFEPCSARYTVSTPSEGAMAVRTRAGDVRVEDLEGAVSVVTDAGDVALEGLYGGAEVVTGAGDVVGSVEAGAVVVVSGAGDVSLTLEQAVEPVEVSTGAGDVVLEVAPGAWRVDVRTQAGDVVLDGVWHDASANRWLHLETGAGDIVVTGW